MLLKDPEQAKQQLVDNQVRRAHCILILLALAMTAYCTTVMTINQREQGDTLVEILSYSVYAVVILYRLIIVVAYCFLYAELLKQIKKNEIAESKELMNRDTEVDLFNRSKELSNRESEVDLLMSGYS